MNSSPLLYPPHAAPLKGDESALRATWQLLRNPIAGFGPMAYGRPIVSLKTFNRMTHVVTDPKGMNEVLVTQYENFHKADIDHRILGTVTERGLLNVEGNIWRRQRRAMSAVFTPRHVAGLAPIIGSVYDRFFSVLKQNPTVDLREAMADVTFDVLAGALLGDPKGVDRERLKRDGHAIVSSVGTLRPDDLLRLPMWIPRVVLPSTYRAVRRLQLAADDLIKLRDPENPGDDLIGQMISSKDQTGQRSLSDREVRDNLIGFFIAGHETTALTLTWALYMLGLSPENFQQVRDEVCAAVPSGPIHYKDIDKLKFTRAVIDETLRLYPPAPIFNRQCIAPTRILGRDIEVGDVVLLNCYIMHRTERLWDNPLAFMPQRFIENPSLRAKGSPFMPFGGGPRVCIGAAFAIMESVMILASLVRDFDIRIDPASKPTPVMKVTLQPQGGIQAEFKTVNPVKN